MFNGRLSLNCRLSLRESAHCERTFAEQKATMMAPQPHQFLALNSKARFTSPMSKITSAQMPMGNPITQQHEPTFNIETMDAARWAQSLQACSDTD